MGGPKKQKTEAETLNSMEYAETKLQKKHKNKEKRKLEETDAEFVTKSKKDVKKESKKEEQEETLNGLADTPTKKKKKQKNEDVLNDGSAEISKKKKKKDKVDGKEEMDSNGPVEESRKKKKKDKEGEEKEIVSKKDKNDREGGENAMEEVRESIGVVVSGKNVNDSKYKALSSFVESGLPGDVLECCQTFDKPSPIQSHSWPFLLDGRDFIGIAATGSGKLFLSVPLCFNIA